jgi:proteasome-associated ATPase
MSAIIFSRSGQVVGGTGMHGNADRERELAEQLRKMKDEPRLVVVVVEIRGDHMLVSLGQGAPVDIHALKGARVGDRVLLNRNTMQATEIIPDDAPGGIIVTAERVTETAVEGTAMGILRAFKAPPFPVRKGERVIVDGSMTFVIGTLGMPPPAYTLSTKIDVSWDDIGGQEEAKEALREAIELPITQAKLFKAYGKRVSRGVLLSGPPGTGKTLCGKASATAIAREFGDDGGGFIYLRGPELLSKWIGQSEAAVREVFAAAREFKSARGYPAIVFMDECDALLSARDLSTKTGLNATAVVQQFLSEMDGLEDGSAMFILATNRPDMLDTAVVRDGRIDRKVRVTRPTRADAARILEIHLRNRPLAGGFGDRAIESTIGALYADDHIVRQLGPQIDPATGDVTGHDLVLRLRDFVSGAMITNVVENAATTAILRDMEAGRKRAGGIDAQDLLSAVTRAAAGIGDSDCRDVAREIIEARR